MPEKQTAEEKTQLHIELVRQMVNLSTSGFGLVAALAWNSLIQEFVSTYVKKWLPQGGLISLFIYALVVTIIAVLVTYNLSMTLKKLQSLKKKDDKK